MSQKEKEKEMISIQVTPPGGWRFNENGLILIGDHFQDLVSILTRHRKSNKLETGNPELEIKQQLYDLYPSIRVETLKMISDVN